MAKHIPGPLYCEQIGATGTPMIFLHSTPDDHRLWMFQTAHFSAWYRTVAVDLAGYGRSPAPQEGVTLADQAAACWELVDRITAGPIIIQGNSMGSEVAMHMADQQPKRTLCMILSGCGYLPDIREIQLKGKQAYRDEGIARRRNQVLFHFSARMREMRYVQHYADMVCALNNAGTLESIILMNQALADANPAFYPRLDVPTFIITASEDFTRESAYKLQSQIRGAEIVCLEGAGHACNFEAPWEFDRLCIDYLKKRGLFPG
jgi:pimeloyl-ACP methyl ester carboxylesterase